MATPYHCHTSAEKDYWQKEPSDKVYMALQEVEGSTTSARTTATATTTTTAMTTKATGLAVYMPTSPCAPAHRAALAC
eukprot:365901-Chlamydomonas_euryale.AAC.2